MQEGAGTVGLTNLFESIINEEKYVEKKLTIEKNDQVVIRSRESMYYYEIFKKLYGTPVEEDVVSKCPCLQYGHLDTRSSSTGVPYNWEKWSSNN